MSTALGGTVFCRCGHHCRSNVTKNHGQWRTQNTQIGTSYGLQTENDVKSCQILSSSTHLNPFSTPLIFHDISMIYAPWYFHVLSGPPPLSTPPSGCTALGRRWDPAETAATGPRSPSSRRTSLRGSRRGGSQGRFTLYVRLVISYFLYIYIYIYIYM